MKLASFSELVFLLFFVTDASCQINRQLQNAIDNVPFAQFAYAADRDRETPPQVANPQAYAYAYYFLPYAIDLAMVRDASGGYVGKVLLDFESVELTTVKERGLIKKAILELQNLLDKQTVIARRAGFADYTNFSSSYISQFASNGLAMISIREMISTQYLINKLINRAKDL